MPNANAPFGLKPVRSASSAPFNDGADPHALLAADTSVVYRGDPVVLSGSADTDGVPSVTLATAGSGNRITGAVSGFSINPTIVANGFRPAGLACHAFVEHDPDLLYEVMANGAVVATDIGANANLIAGAAGNTYGVSGWMLDTASMTTTATLQVRIEGLARRPDNDFGQYAVVLVRINQTTETPAAGSTGV
jgi:hypothetical protein